MTKSWAAGAAIILFAASAAMAAPVTKGAPAKPGEAKPAAEAGYKGPPTTRKEAIKRMEERIAELKKMTDEEWNQRIGDRLKRRNELNPPAPGQASPMKKN